MLEKTEGAIKSGLSNDTGTHLERFEDTKGVIRSRNTKNIQYENQNKKDKCHQ